MCERACAVVRPSVLPSINLCSCPCVHECMCVYRAEPCCGPKREPHKRCRLRPPKPAVSVFVHTRANVRGQARASTVYPCVHAHVCLCMSAHVRENARACTLTDPVHAHLHMCAQMHTQRAWHRIKLAHKHVYAQTCPYISMQTAASAERYNHACAYTHIHPHVCAHVHIHVYTHVCTHGYALVRTHVYAHVYTHTPHRQVYGEVSDHARYDEVP